MPKIDKEILENLSQLSRIAIDEAEAGSLIEDLRNIVAYVEQLDDVDTEGVEPCNHVLALENVWRDDEVGQTLNRKTLLDNAPDSISGMFRVPEVIKR